MSTELKLRRGTTLQHSTFAGALGEVTMDTTRKALVVHDGSTLGGVPVATKAEADAALTAGNNANTNANGRQPADPTLTALAGLATGANQLPYSTGTDTFAQTPLTAFARTLLDDADAATARSTLGVTSFVQGTAQNAAGVAIDFTGIPSGVKRVSVVFNGVSSNGTAHFLVQAGAGSVQTTGYNGAGDNGSVATNSTAGFIIINGGASATMSGALRLQLVSGNIWVADHVLGRHDLGSVNRGGGVVTLSGTLDRVRITTVGGTDTFDSGSFNILYEG